MVHHIISNPFNCSDTAEKGCQSHDRRKSNNSVAFRQFCFVFLISRQNSSPESSAFSHLGQPGQLGSYEEALNDWEALSIRFVTRLIIHVFRCLA